MNPTSNDASGGHPGRTKPPQRQRALFSRQTPRGLEQRVLNRARAAGFTSRDRVVVGFSGGRDSLALAAALGWAQRRLGIEPLLVHVDHRLRITSEEEARRAAVLAEALEMEFRVVTVATSPIEAHPGVGMEEAARRERYRLLFEAADQHRARVVATAHHQRDQAETVLLHLLRGGGVHGAAGMSECAPAPLQASLSSRNISLESQPTAWLWRPLLTEPQEAITAYVERLGLEPIVDPSNEDTTLRRNAVRHDVLPVLERHFPQASAALARYATLAAEDDRALEDVALSVLAELVDPAGKLAATPLLARPLAIQRRVIRLWITGITASSTLTLERTDAVLSLALARRSGRAIEVGEGWTVRFEHGMLRADKTAGQHEEGE